MPVAIVVLNDAIPAVTREETSADLVSKLTGLKNAPALASPEDAQGWLSALPLPSGWFNTIADAKAHLARYKATQDVSGAEIKAARNQLGRTQTEFSDAIGIGGNPNTQKTEVHAMEMGKKRMNPTRIAKMQALVAATGLAHAERG